MQRAVERGAEAVEKTAAVAAEEEELAVAAKGVRVYAQKKKGQRVGLRLHAEAGLQEGAAACGLPEVLRSVKCCG